LIGESAEPVGAEMKKVLFFRYKAWNPNGPLAKIVVVLINVGVVPCRAFCSDGCAAASKRYSAKLQMLAMKLIGPEAN